MMDSVVANSTILSTPRGGDEPAPLVESRVFDKNPGVDTGAAPGRTASTAHSSGAFNNSHVVDTDSANNALAPEPAAPAEVVDADVTPDELIRRRRCFIGLFMLVALLNYDSGAIPSTLTPLSDHFNLGFTEQGLVGSLVYIGLSITSLFAGYLFQRFDMKPLLLTSLVACVGFNVLFAFAPSKIAVLASRVGVGLSQALLIIFTPVWVDEFAPAARRTMWMSIIQAAVPAGIMIGYVVGGIVTRYTSFSFRTPYVVQLVLLGPFTIGMFFVPKAFFAITTTAELTHESGADTAQQQQQQQPSHGDHYVAFSEDSPSPSAAAPPATKPRSQSQASSRVRTFTVASPGSILISPQGSGVTDSTHTSGRTRRVRIDSISASAIRRHSVRPRRSSPYGISGEGETARRGSSLTRQASGEALLQQQLDAQIHEDAMAGSTSALPPPPSATSAEDGLKGRKRKEKKSKKGQETLGAQVRLLLRSRIFMLTVFGLSALYFVVTGIQFWITKYLTDIIGVDLTLVLVAFGATSATAPVMGVFFGGYVVDRLGGYKGRRGLNVASKVASLFGLVAVLCAAPICIVKNFYGIIAAVWVLLFFGGAILPPATGILLSCVPMHLRSLGASISSLFYNLCGYFAGPFISGLVASATDDLQWGFRLVMMWSVFGLLGMVGAWYFARFDHRTAKRAFGKSKAKGRRSLEQSAGGSSADLFKPLLDATRSDESLADVNAAGPSGCLDTGVGVGVGDAVGHVPIPVIEVDASSGDDELTDDMESGDEIVTRNDVVYELSRAQTQRRVSFF